MKKNKLNRVSLIIDINFDDFVKDVFDDDKFKNLFLASNFFWKYMIYVVPISREKVDKDSFSITVYDNTYWSNWNIFFYRSPEDKTIIASPPSLLNLKLFSYWFYPMLKILKKRINRNYEDHSP
mgnify:CR=1 FL=1